LPTPPREEFLTVDRGNSNPPRAQVSWCKLEVELPGPKAVLAGKHPAAAEMRARRAPPPLTAAALTLRMHTDPRTQQQEILAASVVGLSRPPFAAARLPLPSWLRPPLPPATLPPPLPNPKAPRVPPKPATPPTPNQPQPPKTTNY
jgi:hypothetical protein